jgi:hypothetical protein
MPRLPALAVPLGALALAALAPCRADACGGFFSRGAKRLPSIAVEQVLLVHDAETRTEHFIREIAFDRVDRPFGFVIPTPSKPGVFAVDAPSWAALERAYPMETLDRGAGVGFGGGRGRLGGAGVRLLEAKPLGSFAAYVLQATDAQAMKGWLDRNQFVTTKSSEAWLDHYVKSRFYFVALRFDPGLHRAKVAREHTRDNAQTLRITFETPVPFYPYHEPDRDDLAPQRALVLWLVTKGAPKVPVALVDQGGQRSYRRPWREGLRKPPVSADALAKTVGDRVWKSFEKTGEAMWRVQVFEDQKRSRRGFGDVVLVPEEPVSPAPSVEPLRPILTILDPGLSSP